MANVLLVSRDNSIYRILQTCFSASGIVDRTDNQDAALDILHRRRYDYMFIDINHLAHSGANNNYKTAMQPYWRIFPTLDIIVMSSHEMIREAVKAVKDGASNYLTYPVTVEEIRYVIDSLNQSQIVQSELDYLRNQFWKQDTQNLIQTNSPVMRQVFEKIRSVAPTISTVLLVGETGTGKGVLARIIHNHSTRSNAQFISVHCGAIPDTLLESELFGHEKGAFTGATKRKMGKFEIAKDGTIFLDEIATLTTPAQIKLLQILQDKIFHRVGGEQILEANVRIIAATNMDLSEMVAAGQFRNDLYYRLNVFPIEIPPLRDRKEDIPLFIDAFLQRLNKFQGKEIHAIHPDVLTALENYAWPGNIRELENLIERAYILEESSELTRKSFPDELFRPHHRQAPLFPDTSLSLAEIRRSGIEQIERCYLQDLLHLHKGRINRTATAAGISSRQLHKLMKKHGLHKEDFK
jgi:DNA-binding NtrC family response regulator